jgi:eukaryotic-like serine/threonine-protein kinase
MAHQVFICYSSTDKQVADAACAALEAARVRCWIAPRDILAGVEYGEAIIEAISGCHIVVLIFSLQANDSPQVRREVERAVSKEKIIVPFRIEDVLPSRAMEFALSNTHWLDALTPPLERRLAELCDTISRLIRREPQGPAPQVVEPPPKAARTDNGVFRRIFAKLKRSPVAVTLGVALVILAALSWLIPPSPPRLLVEQRTPHESEAIGYPQFQPNGAWLAYAGKSPATGKWDIYVQKYENGRLASGPCNLTQKSKGDSTEPAFSPLGDQIAFSSTAVPSFSRDGTILDSGSDEQSEGIFVAGVPDNCGAAGAATRVAPRGYNPAWSREGMLFASENVVGPEERTPVKSKLFVVSGQKPSEISYADDAVQPSWSPQGRRIAFWFGKNGARSIATIRADGGPAVPLPGDKKNDKYKDWNPVWSPDGYVYFSSDRGGNGFQLWRIRVDEDSGRPNGNAERVEVAADPPGEKPVEAEYIAISQDGSRVAFIDRHNNSPTLWKVGFDPVRATCDPGTLEEIAVDTASTRPDLDPHGQLLIYNKQDALFLSKSDGSGERQLLKEGKVISRGPRWSPDGSRVAFFSNRENRDGSWGIWVGELGPGANSFRQPLTRLLAKLPETTIAIYPVWSPKGDQLAYTIWGVEPRTVVANVSGSNPVPKVEKPEPQFDGRFIAWSWSAKGDKLAGYRQRSSDGKLTGIFSYDFNSRQYTKLTSFGSEPVWLSDNRRLLFLYKGRIYVVDSALPEPERERSVRLVLIPQVARRSFSISADNKWIYFSRENVENRLWIGTLDQSSGFSRILRWFHRKAD